MTKVMVVENLSCANCAAKMERGISKLNGVKSCSLNFLTGKLYIEADEDKMEIICKDAETAVKKVEPEAVLRITK
ncbi:MAG: cation transporter [Clostridiales bacterium]|nr:cation transporter [Clostridiales bacterium]